MNTYQDWYKQMLQKLLDKPNLRGNRTGVKTKSIFGEFVKIPLNEGFPLLTLKKVNFRWVAAELLWFLEGSTNTNRLKEISGDNCDIWDDWADEKGECGPIYGYQWRGWEHISTRITEPYAETFDQLSTVIGQIKSNPLSRRLLVSAWNVADLPDESLSPQENVKNGKMCLAPCHYTFQFYVEDDMLSLKVDMRSCDNFLGLPFNVASYALLLHLIAAETGLKVGDLSFSFGDIHLYENHFEQAELMLEREPYELPKLFIHDDYIGVDDIAMSDFLLEGYQSHGFLKGERAV